MAIITRSEAHLKSRFLNEDLSNYTIIDEEISFNGRDYVLLNDKGVLNEGIIPYRRKDEVLQILKNYDKTLLNDAVEFDTIYSKTFSKQINEFNDEVQRLIEQEAANNEGALTGAKAGVARKLLQYILDGIGLVPGPGEAADAANAAIHLYNKEYLLAALSIISMFPAVGDAVGKTLKLIVKNIDKAQSILDALPQEEKDLIYNKLNEIVNKGNLFNKIDQTIADIKSGKLSVSGALDKATDNTGTLGKVMSYTPTGFAAKGIAKIADKTGVGQKIANAIPSNAGQLMKNALMQFVNEFFRKTGQTNLNKVRDVSGQLNQQPAQQQAAMKNR